MVSLGVFLFQYIEEKHSNGEVLAKINGIYNDELSIYLTEAYSLAKNQRLN